MHLQPPIVLKNVKVHNLKNIYLTLEPHQLIVFTGVSGSGKSSLAFDTIYVEGQRRYIESLSSQARKLIGNLTKPDADSVEGISPTIAIEQKTVSKNPRSTVGTLTGIHDFLRILFAKLATAYCPVSQEPVKEQTPDHIIQSILKLPPKTKIVLMAPLFQGKKGALADELQEMQRKGFTRARLDGAFVDLSDSLEINPEMSHDLDLVIDRVVIEKEQFSRVAESCIAALELGKGLLIAHDVAANEDKLFSIHAFSKTSGLSYPKLTPQNFSFNHPSGMCPACQGLGVCEEFDLDLILDNEKSIQENCCKIAGSYETVKWGNIYDNLAELYHFDVKTPWKKLTKKAQDIFLYGCKEKWLRMRFVHPTKGSVWYDYIKWKGVIEEAKKRLSEATSDLYRENISKMMKQGICKACHGSRLLPYPSAAQFQKKTIHQIMEMTIDEAKYFFGNLKLEPHEETIGADLLQEIQKRLQFLLEVGLNYLCLSRSAPTLSGGEGQRVRLASHIGSGLVGATYVLDEPSIGLHPRDHARLIQTLKALVSQKNTVIVVEHDDEMILAADTIVDIGPLAGSQGGELLVCGTLADLLKCKRSLTAKYLTQELSIPMPKVRRSISSKRLQIKNATHHNLKNVSVDIPLENFVCITGLSGSGKSSLILDILFNQAANVLHRAEHAVGAHETILGLEHINKVICIDQTPIGRTPRSNPATYIKVFDDIRDLFCKLKQSQSQGLTPGHFSFNVQEGSCVECKGMGQLKVDMDFMDDTWTMCPVCAGKRFDSAVLGITFKDKNIFDVLNMTIDAAAEFFSAQPAICHSLNVLKQVGLGYIELGQSSTTLSGGEAQRIKLAKELLRPSTGKTLYILDEPTTGLHFHDISKLLTILHHLVDQKNSVVVIEHNMDFVKTADYVIDLGPDGGSLGGQIIGQGTPEQICTQDTPTAHALAKALYRSNEELQKIAKGKKVRTPSQFSSNIVIEGASQNNLKNLSLSIPQQAITVCTGPSGSGKSSLAFETLYAEGQRRYVESLSSYARQFVTQMPKASVEKITGLSPAIAIEQKHHAGNPRSTVGTMTEVYDFLRVLYANLGVAYCPVTQEVIKKISKEYVLQTLQDLPAGAKLIFLAPISFPRALSFETLQENLRKEGYLRIRLNDTYFELDEPIAYNPSVKQHLYLVIDRMILKKGLEKRLFEAIDKAASYGKNTFIVNIDEKDKLFNLAFCVESTGQSYPSLTPHSFSFNSEEGMCPDCLGLGFRFGANIFEHASIASMSPSEILAEFMKEKLSRPSYKLLLGILKKENVCPDTPLEELERNSLMTFLQGSSNPHPYEGLTLRWIGLYPMLAQAAQLGDALLKKSLQPLLQQTPCPLCKGSRLTPLASHVKLNQMTLPELCNIPLEKALAFIKSIELSQDKLEAFQETLHQVIKRLEFLEKIGLGYLSLHRSAPTLSGGETQRIFLAKQLGSGLSGTLYILDEPTIGLHPFNNHLLNEALIALKNLGNTLVLVEHDPMTMEIADHIIDFGPGAGIHGGEVVASGTLEQIKKNPKSLTGRYLSGKSSIPLPDKRVRSEKFLTIHEATQHNLKNFSAQIPIGCLTCISGVSGSGKSTLVHDVIKVEMSKYLSKSFEQVLYLKDYDQFDKMLSLDQNPVGTSNRADVSTYVDLLTPLRGFFAKLPQAAAKGLQPAHFSFNHKKGMCKECEGLGYKHVHLQFLPSIKIECPLCQGLRLNSLSLQVKYKEKNMGEILQLPLQQAQAFLPPITKIHKILKILEDVGLEYLHLGQEIARLSGGEAQRLRLARELIKRSTGKTLYLFDEPTIGLHFEDIKKLINIFRKLILKGNTVVIIEHNLDILAQADHIIDLGPFGGLDGGELVAQGTPEEIANNKASLTGKYLHEHLQKFYKQGK